MDKITFIVLGVPLWLGIYLAYTISRIKFPDSEDNSMLDSDMMGQY